MFQDMCYGNMEQRAIPVHGQVREEGLSEHSSDSQEDRGCYGQEKQHT